MTTIILADADWGIAKNNRPIASLRSERDFLRVMTREHTVIYGHKTLETLLNGEPLPDCRNWILSKDRDLSVPGARIFHSAQDILREIPCDAYIIGGVSVYEQFLPYCHDLIVTRLEAEHEADCFLSDPIECNWEPHYRSPVMNDDSEPYRHEIYHNRNVRALNT